MGVLVAVGGLWVGVALSCIGIGRGQISIRSFAVNVHSRRSRTWLHDPVRSRPGL